MRTTFNLKEQLYQEASRVTGVSEKTALIHMGLEALVRREAAKRLAALGGTQPKLKPAPRRRSAENQA